MPSKISAPSSPDELLRIDGLLDDEERQIRDSVRALVKSRITPEIAAWYENGELPVRELAVELGELGLLGMHLQGYGCAGTSAVAYGLACLELEAGDSGIRSLVSVQGSLAMFALHAFGSDELKAAVAARHGGGPQDRMLRSDRARLRFGSRRNAHARNALR